MSVSQSKDSKAHRKTTGVIKILNYSRALALASATGPLGTALKEVLESDRIASDLCDKLNKPKDSGKWEWSKLKDENSFEWKTLISELEAQDEKSSNPSDSESTRSNSVSTSLAPWKLKGFESSKVKLANIDVWDVTVRIKILGRVFHILNRKETCDALEKLKNQVRNPVVHSGPAHWNKNTYSNLKKVMHECIPTLLANVPNSSGLERSILEMTDFIFAGKCWMLKLDREYVLKVLEPLDRYLEGCSEKDFQQSQQHFGLSATEKTVKSRISLLSHICNGLPADHGEKIYRFIVSRRDQSNSPEEVAPLDTILIKPKCFAWHKGYTVTFKFLVNVVVDEKASQYQQSIANKFNAEFQHIRHGCTELSFVMEDIHAHCLPAKILDPNNFDMLQLQEQRPVVTVFGCLAFSPSDSEDKYLPYFMGTGDIQEELLREYDTLIKDASSLDSEDPSIPKDSEKLASRLEKLRKENDKSLLEKSKEILEKLNPSEDDPSEDDPPQGVPVPQTRQTSSVKTHASHESYSLHGTQMSSPVQESPVPPVLPPIRPMEPMLESLSPHREQWTYEGRGADRYKVRSSEVKRLAVVFCNNIPEEELTQKSHWWKDALAHRKFDVQVVKDATLSTFQAFCRNCEGREYVAFVFIGESTESGKSINLSHGEKKVQPMTNLFREIISPLLVNPKLESCKMMMFFDTTNPISLKIIDVVTESAVCDTPYIAAANSDKGDFSEKASKALKISEDHSAFKEGLRAAISEVGKIYTNPVGAKWDLWSAEGTPPADHKKKLE